MIKLLIYQNKLIKLKFFMKSNTIENQLIEIEIEKDIRKFG